MIITGGSLKESEDALQLAREHGAHNRPIVHDGTSLSLGLYATVGCHPTRSTEFDGYADGPDAYFDALDKFIEDNISGPGRVVAVGECGLDYDRLHFSPAEVQQTYFRLSSNLPDRVPVLTTLKDASLPSPKSTISPCFYTLGRRMKTSCVFYERKALPMTAE